ncbi:ubiquitin carboxyl-terminal hydrolase 47 isoform X2 [Cephus cinctus]|uniref:Ubiquitin carboxyl-terminal hydrolase 47 n=1 Tax=Cephus cinctus TaxID=211228 RepID=A0AAJ7RKE6_CEPCN|nr:ubiquitin carboxyl-terminal hydrolase 47 isoform X2 [Cephus cinctus]
MVCVAGDDSVDCVIRDLSRGSQPKTTVPIRPSTTVTEIFKHVAGHYSYDPDTFELVLQTSRSKVILLNEMKNKTMMEAGLDFAADTRYTIIVADLEGLPPRRTTTTTADSEDELVLGTSASPTLYDLSTGSYNSAPVPPPQPSIQEWPDSFTSESTVKSETRYVGLVNQAMTCYLNSLLQALYMTPEFRNALYNWEFVDGSEKDEAKSIPYQLQKLFLNLQTSMKSAVETTSLTKSFGWDSTEAWQQHDIQELCRVMFDALEQKFKNTEQADLINRLYEGKMIDYVKCLECSTEKSREDTFLDIPLPVRPYGSNVAYNSVEEALRAFVQPETLDGNNQYHCEKCNKKCDAHKGLKFTKFPYLLTLHLKRFDFDYNTFHRIKLNDKVTFPDILNLNSFIASASNQESPGGEEDVGLGVKCDDSSTTDSGTLDDECPPCDNSMSNSNYSNNHDQDDDEGIDVSNTPSTSNCSVHNHENEKNRGNRAVGKGPYQYELFSIMIHSGSASGGHYYAYIKDLKTQEWFCFNDQSVSRITHDDIQKTYGGGPTRAYYSGAYSSSTNAYMLMYRQIDPARNTLPMQVQDFPAHIQDLLKKMKESEENDRKNREKQISMCKFKVYCHHPTEDKLLDMKLYVLHDETWAGTTEKAYRKFGLEGVVNLDQCRLVSYDRRSDLIECSFEGKELETISEIWRGDNRFDLLLEIRKKDQKFETYLPGGIALKVFVVDVLKKEIVDGPINVRGLTTQTVKEFKQQLGKILNMDPKQMKLVYQRFSGSKPLENDDNQLQTERLINSDKIYVSTMIDPDPTKPYHESVLNKIIANGEHIYFLHIQLPDTSKEILYELNIPSLEDRQKEKEKEKENEKEKEKEREEEKPVTNGPSKLSINEPHKDTNLKCNNKQPKIGPSNEDTSVRNSSPQLVETEDWFTPEQSNSEDSSLSDSDRTLVGDAPEEDDCVLASVDDFHNVQTYERLPYSQNQIDTWRSEFESDSEYYFKAVPYTENNQKMLKVSVDRRMQLSTLKEHLEPYVGVPMEYFKVYRQLTEIGEAECHYLTEQILTFDHGDKLTLKLGRALRSGECKVRLYQLLLNATEPYKFLCEYIASRGATVAQTKREILAEIKRKCDLDIPYERCRLRKKNYKTAARVLTDLEKFDVPRYSCQLELIVQELPDKEVVTDPEQMLIFVRRWSPSKMQLGPFQEIVLNGNSIEELKEKLSSISEIPEQFIEVAHGKGTFPCEISVLRVQNDLDWNYQTTGIDAWPHSLEDGSVVFYRDNREEQKNLNAEELKEIASKESFRLMSLSSTSSYSPRRERALKIYLDNK